MIFNDKMMFIHIGKTGGSSASDYLIHNLNGPAWNCHVDADQELAPLGVADMQPRTDIIRHCTLTEARDYVAGFDGRKLEDFRKIVTIIRHPYTLEYSHYHYMKLPVVREREKHNQALLERTSGDFLNFVSRAGYHRKQTPQEGYFLVDGVLPANVELVRHEDLAAAFARAVAPFLKVNAAFAFPHVNGTGYTTSVHDELTDEIEDLIYHKHRYMFDSGLYARRKHRESADSRAAVRAKGKPEQFDSVIPSEVEILSVNAID
ncbi:MAG: hypothetical protein ACREO8_12515 [Luteimonas sp.]